MYTLHHAKVHGRSCNEAAGAVWLGDSTNQASKTRLRSPEYDAISLSGTRGRIGSALAPASTKQKR